MTDSERIAQETHYIICSEHCVYRVRPNPETDRPAHEGGVALEWKNTDDIEFREYFLVEAAAAKAVADAIYRLIEEGGDD